MRFERSQFSDRVRVMQLPGGWLGKALVLVVAAAIGVLALSFSLAILAVALVFGIAVWVYFFVRRTLFGLRPMATPRRRWRQEDPGRSQQRASTSGRVIEGEVVREAEPGAGGEKDESGDGSSPSR